MLVVVIWAMWVGEGLPTVSSSSSVSMAVVQREKGASARGLDLGSYLYDRRLSATGGVQFSMGALDGEVAAWRTAEAAWRPLAHPGCVAREGKARGPI